MTIHSKALNGALILAALLATPALATAATAPRPTGAAGPLPAKPAMVMPWIEDDYTRAMAEAGTRKVPIFVESWAPW